MGIIEDTCYEIQEQVKACHADGSSITEWLDARGINSEEFFSEILKESQGLEHAVINGLETVGLNGIMQAAFRWGYEVAVKKERANLL